MFKCVLLFWGTTVHSGQSVGMIRAHGSRVRAWCAWLEKAFASHSRSALCSGLDQKTWPNFPTIGWLVGWLVLIRSDSNSVLFGSPCLRQRPRSIHRLWLRLQRCAIRTVLLYVSDLEVLGLSSSVSTLDSLKRKRNGFCSSSNRRSSQGCPCFPAQLQRLDLPPHSGISIRPLLHYRHRIKQHVFRPFGQNG